MSRFHKSVFLLFTSCCLGLFLCGSVSAVTLSIEPASQFVTASDPVSVDIVFSDLSGGLDLSAFNFNVHYDASILSFDSYVLGSELTDLFMGQDDYSGGNVGSGIVNLSELSWLMDFTAQPDSFVLATITFDTIATGTSALTFSNVLLGDVSASPISGITFEEGSIEVASAPVPEPATMFLLGSGLLGLVGCRKKRNK